MGADVSSSDDSNDLYRCKFGRLAVPLSPGATTAAAMAGLRFRIVD
jgi:hypothetical protein